MGFFGKLKKGVTWVSEKLNLKTDHKLKGDINDMSDEKLVLNQGSTRRSVASSVTGLILNTVLTVACPVFAAGIAINAWQMGVAATNRHRVKREIKKRSAEKPKFKRMLKENDRPVRDIVLGVGVKGALVAVGAGIVGLDHIGDNFAQLVHHGLQHAISTTAVAPVATDYTGVVHHLPVAHPTSETDPPPHDSATQFKIDHPKLAEVDKGIHNAVGGIGDKFSSLMSKATGWPVDGDMSWAALFALFGKGAPPVGVLGQAAVDGTVNELVQPVTQSVDSGIEELVKHRSKTHIKNFTNLGSSMTDTELDVQARKAANVALEMRRLTRRRDLRGGGGEVDIR